MSKNMYIFPVSDLHVGSSNFNKELWDIWKSTYRGTTKNKIIYLLGDLIEAQTVDVNAWESNMSVDEQVEKVVKMLKPFKKNIRYSVRGNHEARLIKKYNLDISKIIADRLGINYSANDFFDEIEVNDEEMIVYGKHGSRTSRKPDLAMKNFKDDMADIKANICLQGHNHYCSFSSHYIRNANGGFRKYYGFTGHYLNYKDSYAHNKGYAVSPASFMRIDISDKMGVNCKKYYSDELIQDIWR